MSNLPEQSIYSVPSSLLSVQEPRNHPPAPLINWQLAAKRRELTQLAGNNKICYLLKPEIDLILEKAKDNRSKHFLINTLWHTGARISEALALTKGDFIFDEAGSFVKLITLKQKKKHSRLLPLVDKSYLDEARMFLGDLPKAAKTPLWEMTRATFNVYLNKLSQQLNINSISPHDFRHSFAINAILHLTPLPVLQQWLGHASIGSTAVYTKIFEPDTLAFMSRIGF